MQIITNHHAYPILYWEQLTDKEKNEIIDGFEDCFFRYKGWVYNLSDFMRVNHADFSGWDGYLSDSYFSGILIKLCDDGDCVKVATYIS